MKKYLLIALLISTNCVLGTNFLEIGHGKRSSEFLEEHNSREKIKKARVSVETEMEELYETESKYQSFRMLEKLKSWIKKGKCDKQKGIEIYSRIVHETSFCAQTRYAACLDMIEFFPQSQHEIARNLLSILEDSNAYTGHQILAAQTLIERFKDNFFMQVFKKRAVKFLDKTQEISNYIDFMSIMDIFLKHGIYTHENVINKIVSHDFSKEFLYEQCEIVEYLLKNILLSRHPRKQELLEEIFQMTQTIYDEESERLKGVNLDLEGDGRALSIAREILESASSWPR